MFSSNASQVSADANYIEDVFSTYLYTGNGSTQTITNGIDLAGEGGLVWIKARSAAGYNHALFDTVRGVNNRIKTDSTDAQNFFSGYNNTFNANGFSIGGQYVDSGVNFASWTFREQPKFFDVVTFTAPSSGVITVNHNLGATPGCVITKATGVTQAWFVNHRSLASDKYLVLNTTAAQAGSGISYTADSTTVTFSAGYLTANATYVMYLFAHDSGGFGLTGTDNVISCGSVTDNNRVELGYEPQFLLMKTTSTTGNWILVDTMRGLTADTSVGNATLFPNTTGAEASGPRYANIDATGFTSNMGAPGTHIYIAIRRGPMKVPESGTSVYNAISRTGTGANATISSVGFPPDLLIECNRNKTTNNSTPVFDRLRGQGLSSYTNLPASEDATTDSLTSFASMDGVLVGADSTAQLINVSGTSYINWFFRRAPSYMDVVCYDGSGSNTTKSHNLGVVPELILIKSRDTATNWGVYSSAIANTEYLVLNSTAAKATGSTYWNSTTPTASIFSLGTDVRVNNASTRYVAYLFATAAGVSKVGSYTGTGTTLQVNCGFTGGARFVLIKRTDSTGDWYVWDSARGIVSGNDPYLRLNSTAAEVTNTDYVDTYSAGFEISSTAPAAINASGGTFIFLAIA